MAYYTNRHFIVGPGRIRFGVGPFGQEQKRISTDRIFCVGVFVLAVVTGHKLPHHYTGLSIFVIAKLQSIDRMVYTVSSPRLDICSGGCRDDPHFLSRKTGPPCPTLTSSIGENSPSGNAHDFRGDWLGNKAAVPAYDAFPSSDGKAENAWGVSGFRRLGIGTGEFETGNERASGGDLRR